MEKENSQENSERMIELRKRRFILESLVMEEEDKGCLEIFIALFFIGWAASSLL